MGTETFRAPVTAFTVLDEVYTLTLRQSQAPHSHESKLHLHLVMSGRNEKEGLDFDVTSNCTLTL